MTDVTELLEDLAEDPGPPSRLRPAEIYTRGRRRRRRLVATTLTAAGAAVVTLVGALAFTALDGGPGLARPDLPAEQSARLRTGSVFGAAASDANHLYAIVLNCPNSSPANRLECNQDLVGSDDGGRTWQVRSRGLGSFNRINLIPLGNSVLLARPFLQFKAGVFQKPGQTYISLDGGKTWRAVEQTGASTSSVPATGWIAFVDGGSAPATGGFLVGVPKSTLSEYLKLANPPAIRSTAGIVLRTATGGLWIAGEDPATHQPAVAVSDDAGRTWSTQVFKDVPPVEDSYYTAQVATLDGRVGYAVSMTGKGLDGGGRAFVHRTTDGGKTWQRVDVDGTAPWSYNGGSSFVTPNGAHVIADLGRDRTITFRISRDGGAHYTPVTLTGLPAGIDNIADGQPVHTLPGGGYLAFAPGDAIYRSTDGLHWQRIVPDAS